jgi:hypothetical protein
MIYLLIGVAFIVLTNLGTLSIVTHYLDKDMKEKPKRSQKRRPAKKKVQTQTKKKRRRS